MRTEDQATFTTPTPTEFKGYQAQAPAANAPATLTVEAPTAGGHNVFQWVHWSYSAAPTGGRLTITDGVTTEVMYIAAGGPGFLPLSGAAWGANLAVTFTLAAGGAGITGSLAVLGNRKV